MPSELQSLTTIFNSCVFRVPDYQRGFAWKKEHLDDFWEDLDRLDSKRKHYTGQLTLEKVPGPDWKSWPDAWLIEGKGYKPYYIVDGQQRLTTAIILIKCLLDRVPDAQQLAFSEKSDHIKQYLFQSSGIARAFIFGYQRDNPSYEYFKTQILEVPQVSYEGIETTYTANLLFAREFFQERLQNADMGDIERWFKSLTQSFVFNLHELVEDLDVFVVFETMNNRGKKLSKLELLKNRLIYLSTLLPNPVTHTEQLALRKDINDSWKTVFEYLGKEKEAPLDDDDFLWAHWAMYFPYNRNEAGVFEKFLLVDHFTVGKVAEGKITASTLQDYVVSIQSSVRKWYEIHFPKGPNALKEGVRRGLERLGRLGFGAFEPLLMAALQVSDDDDELQHLLQAAERFVFVINRLYRGRSDTGSYEFYRLANQLFERRTTVADAVRVINSRTDGYFSKEKALAEMRELFRNDAGGFYGWPGLGYLLFEYEQDLKTAAKREEAKIDWDEFSHKDYETIEHIYPKEPKLGGWPSFDAHTKQHRDALRNSLGNLLALSQRRNSSFSNRPFNVKKQDMEGVKGYFNGSYSEIAVAQLPDWTPEAVLKRGLEMLDFLERRWAVSLGPRAEKVRFLCLEFMEDASMR